MRTVRRSQRFVAALTREIALLEGRVPGVAGPDLVSGARLDQLREVAALYDEEIRGQAGPTRRSTRPRASAEVLDAVLTCLTVAGGGPLRTRDIYDYVLDLGITINGSEPLNNLSAIMSNSGLFVAKRPWGWSLKPV